MGNIIGAAAFHGPVRDGKGWYHSAMVVRPEGWLASIRKWRLLAGDILEEVLDVIASVACLPGWIPVDFGSRL